MAHRSRLHALGAVLVATVLVVGCQSGERDGFDRPDDVDERAGDPIYGTSTLLIVLDTTRADALDQMPLLNALVEARGGFASTAVTASNVTPSGFSTVMQGIEINPVALEPDPDAAMVSEAFQDAGYSTYFVAANAHVSFGAFYRGFDTVFEADLDDELALNTIAGWVEETSRPSFVAALLLGPHLPYDESSECALIDEEAGVAYYGTEVADAELVRGCYYAAVADLDSKITPVVEAALDRGWNVAITSDHGEDLLDSAIEPRFSHALSLNEMENRGVYVTFGLPEPASTPVSTRSIARRVTEALGIPDFPGDDRLVSSACHWLEGAPMLGVWSESAGAFTLLTEAEAEGQYMWPDCTHDVTPEDHYRREIPDKMEILRTLGYVE